MPSMSKALRDTKCFSRSTRWAGQMNDDLLRKQAACWDAEIGRRVFLERLLGRGQVLAAEDSAAAAPVADWPFAAPAAARSNP